MIFLKYMLGKIFVYLGNKASGKVSLVSPLVIIKVYINSLSMLQEHNSTFLKKIRTQQKKRKKQNLQFLLWRIQNRCRIFVFILLLLEAVYKKGRIWERWRGGVVYEKAYKEHWPPPPPLEECRRRGFFLMSSWAAATSCSTRLRATSRV